MLRLRQRWGRIRTRGEGNDRAPLRAPRGALQAIPQSRALRLAHDVCGQMGLAAKLGANVVCGWHRTFVGRWAWQPNWAQIWSNFCRGCSMLLEMPSL